MFHIGRDPMHVSEMPWEHAANAMAEMMRAGVPAKKAREHIEGLICQNALTFIVKLVSENPGELRFRN